MSAELTPEQRETLLVPCSCGHTLNDHGSTVACWLCEDEGKTCAVAFEALLVERTSAMLAAAKAEALREAADAWTRGAWSDVMLPKPPPPAVPVIAYSNRMGDWLRDRADQIGGPR